MTRYIDGLPANPGRGPNGRLLCRWCATEVPKGRQTFCSKACVDEYLVRSSSAGARRVAFERDKGVCALCGIDTQQIVWELERLLRLPNPDGRRFGLSDDHPYRLRQAELRQQGYDTARRSLWDLDHIVPVVEGGGRCGLDNLRTLCQPCHKRVTAELAARRAVERWERGETKRPPKPVGKQARRRRPTQLRMRIGGES